MAKINPLPWHPAPCAAPHHIGSVGHAGVALGGIGGGVALGVAVGSQGGLLAEVVGQGKGGAGQGELQAQLDGAEVRGLGAGDGKGQGLALLDLQAAAGGQGGQKSVSNLDQVRMPWGCGPGLAQQALFSTGAAGWRICLLRLLCFALRAGRHGPAAHSMCADCLRGCTHNTHNTHNSWESGSLMLGSAQLRNTPPQASVPFCRVQPGEGWTVSMGDDQAEATLEACTVQSPAVYASGMPPRCHTCQPLHCQLKELS